MSIQTVEISLPESIIKVIEIRQGPVGGGGGGASTWNSLTGTADAVPFTLTTAPTHSEGKVYYDEADHSLTYFVDEAEVAMNIGREMWIRVRNNSGSTIANGKVVYLSGATGQTPTIALARADTLTTSRVIGVATHDIENNSFGYVTTVGEVKGLNTSAFTDGAILFLSAATAGEMTTTAPSAPNRIVQVATVSHAHVTLGKLYAHPESDSIDSTGIADSTSTGRALVTAANAAAARTTLDLASFYQPLDADLTSWAGVTRASGFDTFTATPSSSNLRSLLTDETGTGSAVFGTNPTLNGFSSAGPVTLNPGPGGSSDPLAFNHNVYTYGSGTASQAHRIALGAGTTGDALFTAASVAAANTALNISETAGVGPVTASTQNVDTSVGSSISVTAGTYSIEINATFSNASTSTAEFRLGFGSNPFTANPQRFGAATTNDSSGTALYGNSSTGVGFVGASTAATTKCSVWASGILTFSGSNSIQLRVRNTAATGTVTCDAYRMTIRKLT